MWPKIVGKTRSPYYHENKDDEIYNSKASEMGGQTNINTCRTSEFNKQKINLGLNKILRKFVTKMLKYRILFKDILKFLGLDY